MRAGFIEAPGKAYYIDTAPEQHIINDSDVKIKVEVVGICGSEIHAYHGKHPFRIPPVVSGHEFAGVIVEVGKAVSEYKPGDRVTVEPHYGCGHCAPCKAGKYNICADKTVLGTAKWSGPLGEYIVAPEKCVVTLPPSASFDEGALIEPLAVGMHAVRQMGVDESKSILVIGAGTIGLGVLLCAKMFSPRLMIIADIVDYNLNIAREMGCQYAINSAAEDLSAYVDKLTDGNGADITFMAFGNAASAEMAARCTARGGVISEIAMMPNGTPAPFNLIQNKELSVIGSNMYTKDDFIAVSDAMMNKRIDPAGMITHSFPIERFTEAMELMDKRPEPCVKVLLNF